MVFKLESASGLLLLIAAIVALLISNSNLADYYFDTINTHILIGTKNFGLDFSVLHWINNVLMCVFFFVVTLEIKTKCNAISLFQYKYLTITLRYDPTQTLHPFFPHPLDNHPMGFFSIE